MLLQVQDRQQEEETEDPASWSGTGRPVCFSTCRRSSYGRDTVREVQGWLPLLFQEPRHWALGLCTLTAPSVIPTQTPPPPEHRLRAH